MVQHILIGSLLYNVLITWAILQEQFIPSPRQILSLPLPQNKKKLVHSVIFEPEPKLQLTWSSYKKTSYLDFQPFLKCFQAFYEYLENFKKDLNNPKYIKRLVYENLPVQITPLLNETLIKKYFNSKLCRFNPFLVLQNLKMNNIDWRFNTLIKYFMLFIRNFLQP